MATAWYWARAELRRRWRTWLSVAVLVGIGGGVAMASLAAARRTDTAYPRFLEQARPPDFVLDVDFEVDTPEFFDDVVALSGVVGRSDARAVALGRVIDGRIDIAGLGSAIASADGERFYELDRVHVTDGRMPDPTRAGEVLVSQSVADDGMALGDRISFGAVDVGQMFGALEAGESGIAVEDALMTMDVEVTGVGVFPETALTEAAFVPDAILLTPALHDLVPEASQLWSRVGVHLVAGTDPGAVKREVRELAAAAGGDVFFEDRAAITDRAQRAVRPYVLALVGLGVAGAVFVALLATQLVRRSTAQTEPDRRVVSALSADRRTVRLGGVLPAAVAGGVAALLALAVQVSVSRWTPVGPVAATEPDPGLHVDWAVAGPGLVLLVGICILPALVTGRRPAPTRTPAGTVATWAGQGGAPLTLVLGLARAAGQGGRGRRVEARSGLASVAVAVAMLVAVVTFASSLARLVDTPEVHGWNADVGLLGAGGYGSFDVQAAADVEDVESISAGAFGSVSIGNASVPGMAVVPLRGALLPPVLDGRAPTGPDELALGRASLAEIGASIGDVVDVRVGPEDPAPMTIVGTTVLPGLGQLDADRPSLGTGAYTVLPAAAVGETTFSLLLADFEPGADAATITDQLVAAADEQAGQTDVFHLFRPADVDAFARVGAVPLALVVLFGLVALGSLLHVLLVTARAWRADRAVLAALGATPRQLRSTVRWQSLLVAGLATAIALPIGSAVGRWSWRSLAEETGIVSDPVLPAGALVALVAALLAVAFLLTAVLERRAADGRPVDQLRVE